jgi:antagonist of KipI
MEITVLRAGMLTTVQDSGRPGYREIGLPLGGAMDPLALRVANLLVGNSENTAGLEVTLVGPELLFSSDALIAVTGAEFSGFPQDRPISVRAGERLVFGSAVRGCRGYLAIAGGIDVAPVLGSCATNVRDGFGGYEGRALRDGDVISVFAATRKVAARWYMDHSVLPPYWHTPVVRVVAGAQANEFDEDAMALPFKITPRSDRMGLRLSGKDVVRRGGAELWSAAVAPGTIQVPPDGQPIVLMADAQTIGGYPQWAHVISVDLPLVAQLRPGDTVQFQTVSLADAHRWLVAREQRLGFLHEGLAQKITSNDALH